MKAPNTETTSSNQQAQHRQKHQPFFKKEGEGMFLSKASPDLQTKPFFSPDTSHLAAYHSNSTPFFSAANVQPKLTIGQPNDKYELEADSMADQVVQKLEQPDISTPNIQSKCAECEQEEILQQKEEIEETDEDIQEKSIFESEEEAGVQTKANLPTSSIESSLASSPIANAACHLSEMTIQKEEKEQEEEVLEIETSLQKKPIFDSEDDPAGGDPVRKKVDSGPSNANPDLEHKLNSSKGSGNPLPKSTSDSMGHAMGADFTGVNIHTGANAVQMNQSLGAHAFTHGSDIYFNEGKYSPETSAGKHLLAHELTHTVQQGGSGIVPKIQRETAQAMIERFTDWGGLNLQEEELGAHLATLARAGNYHKVVEVINALDWADRDDVANSIRDNLTILEIIQMARSTDGVLMLRRIKEVIGDSWGWHTAGERENIDLLDAVLGPGANRNIWNQRRIEAIKEAAGSDLEALAQIFEDDQIIDEASVSSRLTSILGATEHLVIPGLQTSVAFSDTGFAGDRNPGGEGFRDPHESSRNQVGHFLTAVGLQFSPGVVSQRIPFFGTIRSMVEAPAGMSDDEVALRLTIGHEKGPDPSGSIAVINVMVITLFEQARPGPSGETEEEREARIARNVEAEIARQIQNIINAFKRQFDAATDEDIEAWNAALEAMGNDPTLDMAAAEPFLQRITIDPSMRGNSIQDLRLSVVGWRLGQLIQSGFFSSVNEVATWIRTNLGAGETP